MSNETKWTKGPWAQTDHGVGELVVFDIEEEGAICIFSDEGGSYAFGKRTSETEEAKANANLIAAAPEGYESNVELVDALLNALQGKPVKCCDEVIERALAYQRKARGES